MMNTQEIINALTKDQIRTDLPELVVVTKESSKVLVQELRCLKVQSSKYRAAVSLKLSQ